MTNRIILITGGSRGLGRAAALALAEHGDDLVLTYRDHADEAATVVAEFERRGRRAVALRLDTMAPETFPEFAETLRSALADTWQRDTFDVLVNNAGFAGRTPFGSIELEVIRSLVDVHLTGVVLLTQVLAPLLEDGGRVLNVSSGTTRFVPNTGLSVYAAVKGAVEVWTRYLAADLGARGIAVNVLAPGATATDFGGGAVRDDTGYRAAILPTVAMGRIGEADDIGAAVAAVLDPRIGWMTGERIEVSGGQRL